MKLKKTRYTRLKPYRYKLTPRPPKQSLKRIQATAEGENLSGYVHGMSASDLEERFSRSLQQRDIRFIFQHIVETPFQIPGQSNEVDYIVLYEGTQPVEIDGMFVHKSAEQKKKDELRDAILDDIFKKDGWKPIIRIPGTVLQSQDDVDKVVDNIF